MTQQHLVAPATGEIVDSFPYTLKDLISWTVKRKDGVIVRYTVTDTPGKKTSGNSYTSPYNPNQHKSLSQWCEHNPGMLPIFETEKVGLWIADAAGVRKYGNTFDLIIDCGEVVNLPVGVPKKRLKGYQPLVDGLSEFAHDERRAEVLKIDWDDRKAPPVDLGFWPALAKRLESDDSINEVVINCQGGHGRSGTALTALMMVLTPTYNCADAILHLRAMHCPRAIESKEQHEYLDKLAVSLNRKGNSNELVGVANYRERFLAIKKKAAKPYQDRLRKAGVKKEES